MQQKDLIQSPPFARHSRPPTALLLSKVSRLVHVLYIVTQRMIHESNHVLHSTPARACSSFSICQHIEALFLSTALPWPLVAACKAQPACKLGALLHHSSRALALDVVMETYWHNALAIGLMILVCTGITSGQVAQRSRRTVPEELQSLHVTSVQAVMTKPLCFKIALPQH